MLGIPLEMIIHKLNIDPKYKLVCQKRRSFMLERQKVIDKEVGKVLAVRFIQEVHYPRWLANMVMVKRANGMWRICIDYTYLNKVCPKNSFLLSEIDQLIDVTSGHRLLSFMNAFFRI